MNNVLTRGCWLCWAAAFCPWTPLSLSSWRGPEGNSFRIFMKLLIWSCAQPSPEARGCGKKMTNAPLLCRRAVFLWHPPLPPHSSTSPGCFDSHLFIFTQEASVALLNMSQWPAAPGVVSPEPSGATAQPSCRQRREEESTAWSGTELGAGRMLAWSEVVNDP